MWFSLSETNVVEKGLIVLKLMLNHLFTELYIVARVKGQSRRRDVDVDTHGSGLNYIISIPIPAYTGRKECRCTLFPASIIQARKG